MTVISFSIFYKDNNYNSYYRVIFGCIFLKIENKPNTNTIDNIIKRILYPFLKYKADIIGILYK